MKQSILLMLIQVLSINSLFILNEEHILTEEPAQIENECKNYSRKIQPAGIWFTEEEEDL